MEIRAGGLIGNGGSHDVVVNHKGMDILLGFVVIHNARAVDTHAEAIASAGSHTRRHFNADLRGRVGDQKRHRKICIPYQGIHIPFGTVHGKGCANAHFCSGFAIVHLVLDARSAEGDGTQEIRSGKRSGKHRRRLILRPAFHRYVIQYCIRPSAQEGQSYAALNADGCPGAARGGSCLSVFRIVIRAASLIRVGSLAGFLSCLRRAGRGGVILGLQIVIFHVLGILLGILGSLCTLFGPRSPFLGVLRFVVIILFLRGSVGVGLGVIHDHARGNSRRHKAACGDGTLCIAGSFRAQFPGKGTSGNIPRQFRVLVDLTGGLCLVRSTRCGRSNPTAIVADHGNAVYIIIYNAHANTECFGAFAALRFGAGRVINVGRVRGGDGGEAGRDGGFVINGHDAVAVAVAEG